MKECFIGIDVSKEMLDVACIPDAKAWRVTNDEQGIQELQVRLDTLRPTLIVLEASGGFETSVASILAAAERKRVFASPSRRKKSSCTEPLRVGSRG